MEADEHGMIFHTNHFLQNRLVVEPPWLSGSPVRLDRATKLAREMIFDLQGMSLSNSNSNGYSNADNKNNNNDKFTITPALLREKVFSDTHNKPQSICCHEDFSKPPAQRIRTLFNIVMNLDPNDLGAEVVMGQPGSGQESAVFRLP